MSAKWVRSQRWDDRHLTGALWPVKVVLRTFSSIGTAVCLLSLVALYGILASVPIGLIAKAPTVLFYAATFVVAIGLIAVLPVWGATRFMRSRGIGHASRLSVGIIGFALLAVGATAAWYWGAWPWLRYDPLTGSGVRFFGAFCDKYQAIQFRRLPMMEMSELEFYAWWPLRVVLLLFVANLVTATIRRIEFTVPRIGVLTVHTGIVTIALGSIYYATHKQEGDVLLLAAGPDESGRTVPARAERGFYDNTRTALWVTQNKLVGWDQRPLHGVPRYNDYNLDVVPTGEPREDDAPSLGAIDVRVPDGAPADQQRVHLIDDDVKFRIVGYASYADLIGRWVPAAALGSSASGSRERVRSLRVVVTSPVAGDQGSSQEWQALPEHPARRSVGNGMLGLEYTIGMPEERWNLLATPLPGGTQQALVVEVPAANFRAVYPVQPDKSITVGTTGYRLTVQAIMPQPPMPIVTKGYEGASSSLAIVRVEPPGASDGKKTIAFDRWIYSRFPEITQDLLDELNERGMPKRRDADPAIKISYIDASKVSVYFDEREGGQVRAMVRMPGGNAEITPSVKRGGRVQIAPQAAIELGARMDDAVFVEAPSVVPEEQRNRERIGNHEASAVAVEVRGKSGPPVVRWVPFTQYLSIDGSDDSADRDIPLPDGRVVSVAFGRVRHDFWPPMTIRLHEFEMIPYEHSDTPKDYRSDVVVNASWLEGLDGKSGEEVRRTSLNNPLLITTPYVPPDHTPLPGRVLGRIMSWIAPNQYKFAQAGWDQKGWAQSEQEVAAGTRERPGARFTILGVGTNPGIHIIAAGAVMMSIGIPWAFYLKPWLMQRQKKKIQRQLAGSGGRPPGAPKMNGTAHPAGAKEQATEGAKA